MMTIKTVWAAVACAALVPFANDCLADDYTPKVCAAAVEYRGAPLRATPSPEQFPAAGQQFDGNLAPALAAQLDATFEWVLTKTSAPGMTAAIGIPGEGIWSATRGLESVSPEKPLAAQPYFHWASVGKSFTAAVIMQLVAEGKLDYGDTIARWFPDFPNSQAITIDHLLTHTGGIFSFNTDLVFRRQGGYKSPEECIAIAQRHGCFSCPGEVWSYSNTGYVMLGRIIEQLEGQPLHEVFQRRIIQPLALRHAVALAPRQQLAGLAVGHVDRKRDLSFEPTAPFGAGIIAATADDLVRFWYAMLAGQLTGSEAVQGAYARLYPMFEPSLFYGRGVMLVEVPTTPKKSIWLAHAGGTPGLKSVVAYDVDAGVFVAVAINGNVSAEATANKLLQEVQKFRAGR